MQLSYKSIKNVSGWLGFVDYEIFKTINLCNGKSGGAAVEIGVHHGKSTLPLACFSADRELYVIDVFDNQQHNTDHSGHGDKNAFLKNLKKFEVDINRITIDDRMSNEVQPKDILDAVGGINFFHIDGGHHSDAVASDIRLACNVALDNCVIAIDDMFRPEWPEVSSAAFGSQDLNENGFKLFAIGFNKGYWCRSHKVAELQQNLLDNQDLKAHLHKTYIVDDRNVLVYQRYPLPEWRFLNTLLWYFEIFYPSFYRALRIFYQKLRSTVKPKASNF